MDPAWVGVLVAIAAVAAAFYATWRASQDARAALSHAAVMSEHELRAYVFLKEARMEMATRPIGGTRPPMRFPSGRVIFQYRNSGQTPGKNVTVAARAFWVEAGAIVELADAGEFRPLGPVGPGDKFDDDVDIESLPERGDLRQLTGSGEGEVHLIGHIKYADAWSDERETSFHYYIGGDAGWDEVMTAPTIGNNYK